MKKDTPLQPEHTGGNRDKRMTLNNSTTTDHILSTKLVIPAGPSQPVERLRLLLPAQTPRIVLVCAPAGYGKTTLVASWAHASRAPIAWLSLDTGDNDPNRFLMHFITAIQSRHPEFGKIVMDMLGCTPPPPVAGLMRSLVNQLCDLPERVSLVLDDLHVITESAVHDAINFLVDNQPPHLQLIIASRNDPPFSLARLRGQLQLLEYRAADLRFTHQETQSFCNDVMHFDLPHDQVAILTSRTEGWIVGLQLAAVSLLNSSDKAGFIHSFAGDNRHITDFLLDEVLRSRSDEMQNFLLQTSLLERFNASLCDAVTGRDDSRAMIDQLERSNMFIVSLDHQRLWYRYHHLFTSLLQSRLHLTHPKKAAAVHCCASRWFSENELITEAVNHAIAGGDYAFAADLMEKNGSTLFAHGRIATVLTWSEKLPQELLAHRPVLSLLCAWGCFYVDNLTALGRHIQTAARYLPHVQDGPVGSKERAMYGQLAIMRGCHLAYNGQLVGAITQFKEALASFPLERTMHSAAAVCLGVGYFVAGQLDESQKLLEEHSDVTRVKYNLMVPITATLGLARLHMLRGNLETARHIYRNAMRECEQAGWQDFPACGMLHIGLGELAYLMNDLEQAERHLQRGIELTAIGMWCFNGWGRILLAQTRLAQGATEEILSPESETVLLKYSGRFVVDVAPVSASIGKLWLIQNRIDAVAQWVTRAQLPIADELAAGREAEYLILVRYLIRCGEHDNASRLLEKLWDQAALGKRLAVMIELKIIQAIALQAEDKTSEAMEALQLALHMGEHTRLLRLFMDDGMAITGLLKKLARGSDYTSYAHHLLGWIAPRQNENVSDNIIALDPLPHLFSKKEKQVVSHIAKGNSNQEIAQALFISSNTLNSHMKSIYSKLGVNSRLQAVERLRQLGMVC
jgi:LuxR family maltose regulon positive regulatory protein